MRTLGALLVIARELPDKVPVSSDAFRGQARAALERLGEVVIGYYLANGGGWQEWHLVRTAAALEALLRSGSKRSIFDVYVSPQLPIRGTAGPDLEDAVLASLRAHGEVLMATFGPSTSFLAPVGTVLDHQGSDEEAEVREWFREHQGASIVAGAHPGRLATTPDIAIEGRVPDPDGVIRGAAF